MKESNFFCSSNLLEVAIGFAINNDDVRVKNIKTFEELIDKKSIKYNKKNKIKIKVLSKE